MRFERHSLTSKVRKRIGLLGLIVAGAIASPAQDTQPSPDGVTFKTLVSFDGVTAFNPTFNLVQGADGNLWGAVYGGGTAALCTPFCGAIFKISPGGNLKFVYNFCQQPNCADGVDPDGLIALGADGNVYALPSTKGEKPRVSGLWMKVRR